MRKFTAIASALMFAGFCANAQEADMYISGSFNDFNPDGNIEWALWDDEEGQAGVYFGTFDIPAGEFQFNFEFMGVAIIPVEEESVEVEFTDNTFVGGISMGPSNVYWTCPDWQGGQITVIVDGGEEEITIYSIPSSSTGDEDYTITGPNDGVITVYWTEGDVCDIWYNEPYDAYLITADGNYIDLIKNISGQAGQITVVDSDPYGLVIDLNDLNLADGDYVLVIPRGYVEVAYGDYDEFVENPEIVYPFTLGESSSVESNYEISGPTEGIINIYWTDESVCDIWYNFPYDCYLIAEDGREIDLVKNIPGQAGQITIVDSDPYGLDIDLTSLNLADGEYILVIPRGFLEVAAEDYDIIEVNPEIVYPFTYGSSTGVSGIENDGIYRVYNLQGVQVMEGSDLNSLENGIYIVNGKKIVVRK